MKILAIETSCDETACAIVENGRRVLANVIASQVDIHAKTGGVVPEVAAREHVLKMLPVLDECMGLAGCSWDNIDAIAVTKGPGLISSLIIGTETANVISFVKQKRLIAVQHIVGHIYSNWLEVEEAVQFPVLILTVSGGHNELILMRDHWDFEVLGETLDDAAGEAFDKVARILGLGYPGGPAISKIAEGGDPTAFKFPRAYLEKGSLDFSFSGLKTAVLNVVKKMTGAGQTQNKSTKGQAAQINRSLSVHVHEPEGKQPSSQAAQTKRLEFAPDGKEMNNLVISQPCLTDKLKSDLAASFQEAVVEVLSDKLIMALRKYPAVKEVHLAGGVSANRRLRELISRKLEIFNRGREEKVIFRHPKSMLYCTDNAAMIGAAAYYLYKSEPGKFVAETNIVPVASFEI